MNNIWGKVKPWLINLISCTAFFVLIFLVAWVINGIYQTRFDLASLQNFYLMVVAKQQVQHGIDSVFNSARGEQPTKDK
ncbi:MAG: hypothetical protein ACRC7I_12370 [Selenomonadaceae bacterium]